MVLIYVLLLQSSPKIIVSILVSASKALGKAFYEAGRQAAKSTPPYTHI